MNSSIQTFPGFHDENGITPLIRHAPSRAAEPASPVSFREELAAAAPERPAPPTRRSLAAGEFRDENGGPALVADAPAATGRSSDMAMFAEGDTPSAWDVLDFINPLQHIPVVNTIYREITGDQIGALPRLVGGALLGGPIGAAVAVANLVVEDATGRDVGEHGLAMMRDDGPEPSAPVTAIAVAPSSPVEGERQLAAAPPVEDTLPVLDGPPVRLAAAAPSAGQFMAPPPRGARISAAAPTPAMTDTTPRPETADMGRPLPMPSSEAIRRAAAAQGVAASEHPMLPDSPPATVASAVPPARPPPAAVPTQPAPPAADPQSQGFVNRFMEAMDKYDRARNLGAPGGN